MSCEAEVRLPKGWAPGDSQPCASLPYRSSILRTCTLGGAVVGSAKAAPADPRSSLAKRKPVHSPVCDPQRIPGSLLNARMAVTSAHQTLVAKHPKCLARCLSPKTAQSTAVIPCASLPPALPPPAHFYCIEKGR